MAMLPTISLSRYPKQAAFVSCRAHFSAFIGGIYSAKSYSGCIKAGMAANGWIGNQQIIPTPNIGMITAPTYDVLRDATLRTFREVMGGLEAEFNKNEMKITLRNGSEILFRSTSEPEHRRGPALAWAMMDEAALSPAEMFDILIGRLRQHEQLGYMWVCGTPKGRNWIWQKFLQHPLPDYRLYRAKTRDNPYVAKEIIEAWEASYAGDFARQELEGEFVAFEGLIYPEFDRALHISSSRPAGFQTVVAGVDWGFTNPGVITVAGLDGDGRLYGLHQEYQRQRRIEEWANVALELRNIYHIEHFFCDPSEPNYIKALVEKGCKAEAANNEVRPGIQRVKNRLVVREDGKPRLIFSPDFAWTFSEFEQYQWRGEARSGGFTDEPMKANDHCMDSIRYLVMGVDEPRVKKISVEVGRYA